MTDRDKLDMLNARIEVLKDNIARTENMPMLVRYREALKETELELAGIVESYLD